MYKGIKRKPRKKFTIKFPTKFQMLNLEEEITNGIIRKNYKVKTINLKADENLHWYDFEVSNLLAAGINVEAQKTVVMHASREKMAENAEAANETLELVDIINEIEQEQTPTEQKPNEQ